MQRWRLRESYFTVPGRYTIGRDGKEYVVAVDKNGEFDFDPPSDFQIGIFAKPVSRSHGGAEH